ncbi:MAG TPA: MBL fold metallo-hydrolase [Solirubrobacterales bacterium]|jgi:glyoxylase-like metal-dependent hydrolase (beta-lactamase superfamily II)|nr:MBL fold metallo-hydrolase [Solirubrobacterales bacterium]
MAKAQVVKPRTERIQPGIWRLKLPCPWPGVPHGNAWALQRGAGLVLVDTGVGGPGRLRMLDIALAQSGFGVDDIELVVCTHAHSDHYGLAASICEQTGCELWMHPKWEHIRMQAVDPQMALERRLEVGRMSGVPIAALDRYRQERTDKPEDEIDAIRAPDRDLVPGVEVESDIGTWQVVETPGHAPSHVCLHQPERRLLLSGDHLLGRTVMFFDYGHTADPFGEFLASLDRVEPLPVDLCLPGHGKPFRDPQAKIADVRRQADDLLDKVRATLADGAEPTAFEVVEAIAGRKNLSAPTGGFLLQIVLACLDHLAALGEASPVPDSDPQRWRA